MSGRATASPISLQSQSCCKHVVTAGQEETTKTMKLLSSSPRVVQWMSTLVWDSSQFLFVYGTRAVCWYFLGLGAASHVSLVFLSAVIIGFVYLDKIGSMRVGSTHGLLLLYGPAVAAQCYWVQQLARRSRTAVQTMLTIQVVSIVAVIVSRFMQGRCYTTSSHGWEFCCDRDSFFLDGKQTRSSCASTRGRLRLPSASCRRLHSVAGCWW